ncbi:MAG: hypothetical protein LBU11_05640 [Zoogloeaceae bacterium]|nr:hypothetical protein [Zoogloeaceae bacterium]
MQKRTVHILLFFLALFLALVAYILKDEPLSPAAEKALHYQPSPVPPERNAFVGIAGLEAPAGGDFISAGKENIRVNLVDTEGAAQKLIVPQYTDSCAKEITENCLVEIRADAQNIQSLLAENSELILRYLRLQAMPEFSHSFAKTLRYGTMDFFPRYGNLLNLSRILSARAVLDIQNGRIEEGLGFIERDMNFYRGILASKDINLLDMMIAAATIRQHANLLMLLLQEGRLSGQTDRVRALLRPLDAPRETFTNALWRERVYMIQSFREMSANLKKLTGTIDLDTGETQEGTYFDQLKFMLLFKPNMSLNLLDEIFTVEADIINALAIDALPAQRDVLWEKEIRSRVCAIPKDYSYCRHWKNYVGEVLVTIAQPDHVQYLLRIHDLDARLRLFRARLEFARAAKNAPKAEAPEAILARLGPETFNPYTGKPFERNPETGMIGFMPAADKTPKRVEVRLFPR